MSLAYHAVKYLELGHHIIALTQKRPNPRFHAKPDDETPGWSWERSIYGTPETEEEVKALYEVFDDPTTTGIALLIPPWVLVADVDTEEAASLFMGLVGAMPETATAKTPNGLHIWFAAPGEDRNRWLGGRTLLFKGFGGYVAAPPSAHFNSDGVQDGVYTWLRDLSTPLDFLPNAIAVQLQAAEGVDANNPFREMGGARAEWTLRAETGVEVPSLRAGTLKFVLDWDIEGLCRVIREAREKNQNNVIHWAAMQALEDGVPSDVAMKKLLDAAEAGNHPRSRAYATIAGVFTRGSRG